MCGFQTSKIRSARNSSLSFHASCSIVSSKAKAVPSCHSRVSPPTRKPHPGGTISGRCTIARVRSEEHTSELQSLMRNSYAVFCLKKKNTQNESHIQSRQAHKTYSVHGLLKTTNSA